jgi:hypothetical protein
MPEINPHLRYQLSQAVSAVKLEAHPGSKLRSPTGNLVRIPANVIVEQEGGVPPSGLVTILWEGNAFSVFYEDLRDASRSLPAGDAAAAAS